MFLDHEFEPKILADFGDDDATNDIFRRSIHLAAEAFFGESPEFIISVPTNYGIIERTKLIKIADEYGLNIKRIVSSLQLLPFLSDYSRQEECGEVYIDIDEKRHFIGISFAIVGNDVIEISFQNGRYVNSEDEYLRAIGDFFDELNNHILNNHIFTEGKIISRVFAYKSSLSKTAIKDLLREKCPNLPKLISLEMEDFALCGATYAASIMHLIKAVLLTQSSFMLKIGDTLLDFSDNTAPTFILAKKKELKNADVLIKEKWDEDFVKIGGLSLSATYHDIKLKTYTDVGGNLSYIEIYSDDSKVYDLFTAYRIIKAEENNV